MVGRVTSSTMTTMAMVFAANDEEMVVGDRDQHGVSPVKVLTSSAN